MSYNCDSYIRVTSYDSNESLRNQSTYNRYDSYYESPVKPYDLYMSHSTKYLINDFYLKSCETYEPLVCNTTPLAHLLPTVTTLGRSPPGLVVIEMTLAGYHLLVVCIDKVCSLLSPHGFSFV